MIRSAVYGINLQKRQFARGGTSIVVGMIGLHRLRSNSSSFLIRRCRQSRFLSDTAATKTAAKPESTRWPLWKRIIFWIKISRIPFLVMSVYGLGYQQGIIECTRSPRVVQETIMESVLRDVGASKETVTIVRADTPTFPSSSIESKVSKVGKRIVKVATVYVSQQLEEAMGKVLESLPSDATAEQQKEALGNDDKVTEWQNALTRIEGDIEGTFWRFIIVDSEPPNAFVSELLPQRFFVTTGLFKMIENLDELALVLGHEISHLILGHISERNQLETFLQAIEVLLLSIDPSEGVVTLFFISGIASLRHLLLAANSRDNETEADELGIKLAALACYDTKRAAEVMKKLHENGTSVGNRSDAGAFNFFDSHPPSMERYDNLLEMSKTENAEKYSGTTCSSIRKRMLAAKLW